jgi:serine/threonine protein kinase
MSSIARQLNHLPDHRHGIASAPGPRLPRRDALKVLPVDVSADPEYRARFEREADLASTLWHPHIVSVHESPLGCQPGAE